ncbi:hypothetical protein [Pseudonocardia sp. GCM10023141]|uniref:hypothetical protein n=1 Tax=Pseudonocardia sp. GCM10023141 TaxID=3252653 RepID=UPI0036126EB2
MAPPHGLLARPASFARWAGAGAITASVALPLNEVARIASNSFGGLATTSARDGIVALVATAAYLPLHLRHVAHGLRGTRHASDRWTLAAMTVVIACALPLLGLAWSAALSSLAISVLVLVRPPMSLLVTGFLIALPALIVVGFGHPVRDLYFVTVVAFRTSTVFVLVWLVGAIGRLEAARAALAEQAVDRERLRIAAELRRALGGTLEDIITAGDRLAPLAERDPGATGAGLDELVGRTRRTLADTRRLVTSYRRASLRAELETVRLLLDAAGIASQVVIPPSGMPDMLTTVERVRLQSMMAALLRDESARSCVLTVVVTAAGEVRVDLTADAGTADTGRPATEPGAA